MTYVNEQYRLCDYDQQQIPTASPRVTVMIQFVNVPGVPDHIGNHDFCSKAHAAAWVAEQQEIAEPITPPPPPATPPVNTQQPVIGGTLEVGQTLTINTGTWTGNPEPTFTYQWMSNTADGWAPLTVTTDQTVENEDGSTSTQTVTTSATDATYAVQSTDAGAMIACQVTALNSQGQATVMTPAVIIATSEEGSDNS